MTAPPLTIRLTRRSDGAVVFELRRADGSTTWQKRTGPAAEFFAIHDLTHFAVETILGVSRGFYGLVAEGWALSDFGTPWPRGALPSGALPAEVIVGCFDTARASHTALTAEDCNASVRSYFSNARLPVPASVTEEALARIYERLADLVWRWQTLPRGETLELQFELIV